MRVLVVDDEAGVRQLIRNVIQMQGNEVLEALNGVQALDLAHTVTCDLIITDQMMPGMTGLELIEQLTSERYPARYLLISGYGLNRGEGAGLPFLAKPFSIRQLVELIGKLACEPALPELDRAWREAKDDWRRAVRELNNIVADVPSGIPHPDGMLRIERAGQKRKAAYEKYQAAFRRYKEALRRGGVLGRDKPPTES
jgi:CheY-like chemotaxis protein